VDVKMNQKTLELIKLKLCDEVEALARKVAPFYQVANWRWATIPGVPTEFDIRETLYKLIENLEISEESCAISTGGLKAEYYYVEKEKIYECYISFSTCRVNCVKEQE